MFVSCTLLTSNDETKGPLDVLLDVLAASPFTDLLKNSLSQLGFTQEDINHAKGNENQPWVNLEGLFSYYSIETLILFIQFYNHYQFRKLQLVMYFYSTDSIK